MKTIFTMTNKKRGYLFCLISLLLIVIYPAFSKSFVLVQYSDEIFCITLLSLSIFYVSKNPIYLYNWEKQILLLFMSVMFIGTIPYIISTPNTKIALFHDAFVFSKFIIVYFSTRILLRKWSILNFKNEIIIFHLVLVSTIVLLIITNKYLHLFPTSGIRFGLTSEQLFFEHPSRLAFFFAYTFCILFPFFIEKWRMILLLILLAGLSSLRTKFIVFSFICLLVVLFIKKIKRIESRNPRFLFFIIVSAAGTFLLSYKQILFYYSTESYYNNFARAALTVNGFKLSIENFPIGTGFGTFGSYAAGKYYSPLNYQLGFQHIYGLSPDNFSYMSDTYWPMVLAQFGIIGTAILLIILFLFLKNLIFLFNSSTNIELSKYIFLSSFLLLIHLIIDSSSDAIFTQNRAIVTFFYIALVINCRPQSTTCFSKTKSQAPHKNRRISGSSDKSPIQRQMLRIKL